MSIGIYKITNLINQKIYIGQSVDIERRWKEHLRSGQPEKYACKSERDINTPIHLAMQKYGIENFKLEIICICEQENLNDLEKYYIKFYDSTNKLKGYNISEGGQDKVGAKGEFHSQAKLNQKQVDEIYTRLINGESVSSIHKDFDFVSKSIISMINQGRIWKKENVAYPLSKQEISAKGEDNGNSKVTESMVKEIRQFYVNHPFSEVIKKYSFLTYSNVKSIVYGDSWKHLPIYKKRTKTWI